MGGLLRYCSRPCVPWRRGKKSKEILSKIYKALKKGSRIVICEVYPDENREKDLFSLLFAVNMLVHTSEGNTFTTLRIYLLVT